MKGHSRSILALHRAAYAGLRPLLFTQPPDRAHRVTIALLRWLDTSDSALALLGAVRDRAFLSQPCVAGGVALPWPFIVAAGLVKGPGFASPSDAVAALHAGANLVPGHASVPALLGPVEFGSFTRYPRMGNAGPVLWRDRPTRSTQNRVGLRNPGVEAGAAFLASQRDRLSAIFGINIAPSPGSVSLDIDADETGFAVAAFLEQGIRPAWFTLNLSCPNTEDDPRGNQSAARTERLVQAMTRATEAHGVQTPIWLKVGPELGKQQIRGIVDAAGATGVRAIIATNTLTSPTPGQPDLSAGVGGGRLHAHAVEAARAFAMAVRASGRAIDIIGCGGVLDHESLTAFRECSVAAVQYWSALIYRGPLAAAIIQEEALER
jgi:dihydroorotate dehydrogenase